jgi:hypothetical protein
MNMRDLFANVKQFQEEESKETVEDKEDYSVIRYGVSCTLRGPQVRREREREHRRLILSVLIEE